VIVVSFRDEQQEIERQEEGRVLVIVCSSPAREDAEEEHAEQRPAGDAVHHLGIGHQ